MKELTQEQEIEANQWLITSEIPVNAQFYGVAAQIYWAREDKTEELKQKIAERDEEIARLNTQIEYQRSIFDDINFKLNEAMQSKEVILKEKNDILDKLRMIIG